jgi:hypothetical protein
MISIAPIADSDLEAVGNFLHRYHDATRSAASWAASFHYPWAANKPNNGFMLLDEGAIVGVIGGIYSEQPIHRKIERFCNITSWCVRESHRSHSNRLLMACVAQKGFHFTNFSPAPVVEKTLQFFKFSLLDERYAVIGNIPWVPGWPHVRVASRIERWLDALEPSAAQTWRDHKSAAHLIHALIRESNRYCYVALRRDVVKGMPSGRVMYASDLDLFNRRLTNLGSYLLRASGMATLKVDERFLAHKPPFAWLRPFGARQYFKSETLSGPDINNLYSELVMLA